MGRLSYATQVTSAEKRGFGEHFAAMRAFGEQFAAMRAFGKMAGRFRRCLEPHFKTIHELRFDIKKPYKNNWAYINWLQTDKVLILPKFNAPEDEQAFEQISTLMPEYEGKIVTVEATDLIRHEGCLNCASWTVYEPEEGPRWEL